MFESDTLSLVAKRADFIAALADQPLEKRELVDELGYSRATVNRAMSALEAADLVRDHHQGYEPTLTATLAVETYQAFVDAETDILDSTGVLAPLDHDASISPDALVDAEYVPAARDATYRHFERVRVDLVDATEVTVVVPTTQALPALDHWQDALVADDVDATVVLDHDLYAGVGTTHRSLSWLATQDVDVLAADTPEFVLVHAATGEFDVTHVLVYDRDTGSFGALRNQSDAATAWVCETVESMTRDADRVDGELRTAAPERGGTRPNARPRAVTGLPRTLEAEGFVSPDATYFETHDSRALPTALRTGLTLADVYDGHAIHRRPSDEADPEARTLADELVSRLESGTDCAVVGEPGAGKSTVCKRVACEWFDANHGPVLYRESGQGKPFESVAALRGHLRGASGDVLVVVEDAVRPHANEVFRLAAEFADWDGVRFLFDARTSEWTATRLLPVDAAVREYKNARVAVTDLEPPDEAACDAFLRQYEDETGTTLDLTGEELTRTLDAADAVSGGMFLLAHRVCLRADPVVSRRSVTPTRLVEDVQQRLAALQTDASTVAVRSALLTQLLNLADVPIDEAFLDAQTQSVDGETTTGVRSALGDVQLLVETDGRAGFRTPHDQWSRVFLTEALDVLDDAPELLGAALANVFALATADARSAVETHVEASPLLQRIAGAPTAWADDLATQLFEAGEEVPALAPYYGTFHETGFALREHCSEATVYDCGYRRGQMHSDAGNFERAVAEYRAVLDAIEDQDEPSRFDVQRADCMIGLASIRIRQGEVEDCERRTRRALDLHRQHDNRRGEANALLTLGRVAFRRSEYEESVEYAREALAVFEALGDEKYQAICLGNMAGSSISVDDYDAAETYARRSLTLHESLGSDLGMSQSHGLLGRIAEARGEYERALDRQRQALAAANAVGTDESRVVALVNMGNTCRQLGRLEAATTHLERALDVNDEMGDAKNDAIARQTLGEVARRRGNLARARDEVTVGLEVATSIDNDRIRAFCRATLGKLALDEGAADGARDHLEASLSTCRDLGMDAWVASVLVHLGRVELAVGDHDSASEYASEAQAVVDAHGSCADEARLRCLEARIHVTRDEFTAAERCFAAAEARLSSVADDYTSAVVYCEMGAFEAGRGNDALARAHFDAARELAAAVGAASVRERAERALEADVASSAE
jgi:tetratricopeptide (TPR) repeat protein/predicted transcriptional regulator